MEYKTVVIDGVTYTSADTGAALGDGPFTMEELVSISKAFQRPGGAAGDGSIQDIDEPTILSSLIPPLTKREYFAGLILQGCAGKDGHLVRDAVVFADALIKELAKGEK